METTKNNANNSTVANSANTNNSTPVDSTASPILSLSIEQLRRLIYTVGEIGGSLEWLRDNVFKNVASIDSAVIHEMTYEQADYLMNLTISETEKDRRINNIRNLSAIGSFLGSIENNLLEWEELEHFTECAIDLTKQISPIVEQAHKKHEARKQEWETPTNKRFQGCN